MNWIDIKNPQNLVEWLQPRCGGEIGYTEAVRMYETHLPTLSEALPNDIDSWTIFIQGTIEDDEAVEFNAYAMVRTLDKKDGPCIVFITDMETDQLFDVCFFDSWMQPRTAEGLHDHVVPGDAAHRH